MYKFETFETVIFTQARPAEEMRAQAAGYNAFLFFTLVSRLHSGFPEKQQSFVEV